MLLWKDGEGYDIHLLRGGPASKRLIESLGATPAELASAVFIPQVLGHSSEHGIEVDSSAGIVRALPHPDPTFPRVHNFLLSVVVGTSPESTQESFIRIHIHDSVDQIWLTPATLAIHHGADECRLTVLAQFSDKCIGDITDWSAPALVLLSADESVVKIRAADRVLQAVATTGHSDVTATVSVPALNVTRTSAAVRVSVKKSWADIAKESQVLFVAGKTRPDESKPDGPDSDSVKSVVERATNILFVSEGFRQSQRGDFNNYVWKIVEELRTKQYLLPFPLLKNSVNFWSVFVPSEESGVTVLGDYIRIGDEAAQRPLDKVPSAGATEWERREMFHQVGLPIPADADIASPADQVARWQRLYQPTVTEAMIQKFYGIWRLSGFRAPPDERDTAFGMAIGDRPRASGSLSERFLDTAPGNRRVAFSSILVFLEGLTFGRGSGATQPLNIGATWSAGKDTGLICFVCLSDRLGGTAPLGYFTASTGNRRVLDLLPVAGHPGYVVKTSPPETHSRTVLASIVAHECAHVLGLGDEYGDNEGTVATTDSGFGNLVLKSSVASVNGGTTIFDKTADIKWLWPRLKKAGVLVRKPDQSGTGFLVSLRAGQHAMFGSGDVVQFRERPVSQAPSADPFRTSAPLSGHVFKVRGPDNGGLIVDLTKADGTVVDVGTPSAGAGSPTWAEVVLALFDANRDHALVCPQIKDGRELRLIADFILQHITSHGPLTAKPGVDPGLCDAATSSVMSPTNLPPVFSNKKMLVLADVIGLYEGGAHHDCGVYRPAGRCKMRVDEKLIPFCHVCRYLIVDRIDPTKHGELDAIYEQHYPRA